MAGKQNKVVRLIITSLILLLVLVVLPVGSWYYLKEGLDYRMTKIGELKQYGRLPDFSYTTIWNKPITAADIKDKVVVANVLDLQDEEMSHNFGQILEKLHFQFDERKDVCFLIHILDTVGVNAAHFARQYQLEDAEQCYFILTPAADMNHLASYYHLSADSLYSNFTIIDTKRMVRKHYDVRAEAEVKHLVEHLALLLPLQKREGITLQREREK